MPHGLPSALRSADNDGTDNHGCQVINAKQRGEQLSAGSKSACCIRDKKDDMYCCALWPLRTKTSLPCPGASLPYGLSFVFIMIPFGKEIRNRNGSNLLAVAAYLFGNKKPVQPGRHYRSVYGTGRVSGRFDNRPDTECGYDSRADYRSAVLRAAASEVFLFMLMPKVSRSRFCDTLEDAASSWLSARRVRAGCQPGWKD